MGRPRKEDLVRKLTLLQTIREKKSLLFGQFSSDVEKITIDAAWEEVLVHAKSLALVHDKHDSTHVRRLFSQWKSRTLEKKDNRGKTGTGGGKDCKLTEVDNIILDIIGKESPVVEGLPVGESGNYVEVDVGSEHEIVLDEDEVLDACKSSDADFNHPGTSKATDRVTPVSNLFQFPGSSKAVDIEGSISSTEYPIKTKKRKLTPPTSKELLLEEKWKAQTEYVKQQAYNMMLQNYKLELELGIPQSDLTSSIKPF